MLRCKNSHFFHKRCQQTVLVFVLGIFFLFLSEINVCAVNKTQKERDSVWGLGEFA